MPCPGARRVGPASARSARTAGSAAFCGRVAQCDAKQQWVDVQQLRTAWADAQSAGSIDQERCREHGPHSIASSRHHHWRAAGQAGIDARFVAARVNASVDKSHLSGLSADEQKVLTALSTEQPAEFKQFGDRVSRDASFASLVATDSREAHELASRLSSTTARSDRAGATLAHRTALSERVSSAYEKGETISIDIAQDPYNLAMFMRYAEQYGGDSAAAHALIGAEPARQSLRPNRSFSDGTVLPTSFGQLTEQHAHQSRDVGSSINVDAQHAVGDRQVEGFRRGGRLPQRAAPPNHLPC